MPVHRSCDLGNYMLEEVAGSYALYGTDNRERQRDIMRVLNRRMILESSEKCLGHGGFASCFGPVDNGILAGRSLGLGHVS